MAAKGKALPVKPPRTVADLEAELEKLTAERDDGLARETAVAEVLGVINSSPGDLSPVFDAILEHAHSLCGISVGTLQLYDGTDVRTVAWRGLTGRFAEVMQKPYRPLPGQPASRLLGGERVVHIIDLREAAKKQPRNQRRQAAAQQGFRTALWVPLRKDAELLGYISAFRQEVRPFSEKEIALLESFAAQAVIAMENARLLGELRERTSDLEESLEYQTATSDVLKVISRSTADVQPVLDTVIETAVRLCGSDTGAIWIREGEVYRYVSFSAVKTEPEYDAALRQRTIVPGRDTSIAARAALEGRVVHVEDVRADPDYALPGTVASGRRTMLGVPLLRDSEPIGVIALSRKRVQPFTGRQIELVRTFADQAVIAMENARLIGELRERTDDLQEALEQQTATAEVLGVINSSPSDLAPVFEAMLEKAMRLCDAAHGHLWAFARELGHPVAVRGESGFVQWLSDRGAIQPDPVSPAGRLLRGERAVHVDDVTADESYTRDGRFREFVDAGGIRTMLNVALVSDDAVLGMIAIYRKEVRPFTKRHIALLQNFAEQAVIAMENARLITETREALEQQTATAEVLGVINSSPGDLSPVFDAMLERAVRLCEADFGVLNTFDGARYHPTALHNVPAEYAEFIRREPLIFPPDSAISRITAGDAVAHFVDTAAEARRASPLLQTLQRLGGIRSAVFAALRKEGVLLGVFMIYRQEVRPFTDKQIALLQNFAAQAVIAMENARLLNELRQRTEEVAELNQGLEARVAEQVDELGRVGRLKRFLAPQLAELIVSQGDENILESHRREIVVVFCDLRGYTAFTETAEPEEVLDFLREYHGALGPLVSQFEGTLDQFSGDGIMVFFNDPVPVPDPAERAVKMAMAMREEAGKLIATWRRDGGELGFGAGIAQGYATLGQIGFSERSGYTAIGTVCNLAARLCAEAKDGQILVSSRVARAVEAVAKLEDLGNLELKGLRRPVAVFNIVQSTNPAEARPNLTVVARRPGN